MRLTRCSRTSPPPSKAPDIPKNKGRLGGPYFLENREQRTERAGAKRQTFHGHRTPLRATGKVVVQGGVSRRPICPIGPIGPTARLSDASRKTVVSGGNWDRKDAKEGANRFGLHRSLYGFAADRALPPIVFALRLILRSPFGAGKLGPQRREGGREPLRAPSVALRLRR